jgi:hypothetical protein
LNTVEFHDEFWHLKTAMRGRRPRSDIFRAKLMDPAFEAVICQSHFEMLDGTPYFEQRS